MATMQVKNATGGTETIEKPNANGRSTAANSRSVAVASEDKAVLDAISTSTAALPALVSGGRLPVSVQTGIATAANQDTGNISLAALQSAINGGSKYETVAASQSNQPIGATGATNDILGGVLIIPASTSPGAVSIKDGAGSAITVFPGGASSVSTLHPFFVPLGIRSTAGAWSITTGTNVSAIAVGDFT